MTTKLDTIVHLIVPAWRSTFMEACHIWWLEPTSDSNRKRHRESWLVPFNNKWLVIDKKYAKLQSYTFITRQVWHECECSDIVTLPSFIGLQKVTAPGSETVQLATHKCDAFEWLEKTIQHACSKSWVSEVLGGGFGFPVSRLCAELTWLRLHFEHEAIRVHLKCTWVFLF